MRATLAGVVAALLVVAGPADAARPQSLRPAELLRDIHALADAHDSTERLGVPVRPTSAYLERSVVSFKANCHAKNSPTFGYYKLTPDGWGFKKCDNPLGLPLEDNSEMKSTPGEYESALDRLGARILSSVGLGARGTTLRIGGSQHAVVAKFDGAAALTVTMYPSGPAKVVASH